MSDNIAEKENSITEGVIWKQLLIFFFPILIGTFFQQMYNTIGAVVFGQFAVKEALSCVGGSSAMIINLIVGFFTGLTAGCSVIISQHFGAARKEALNKSVHTAYAFAISGGVVFGILGIWLSPFLFKMMNTPAELMKDSVIYIRIYFSGLVFVLIYNMGSSILRAIGDSKRPLYYLIICSVINIILDLLFVWGFSLGVVGVAVATLISQLISAILVTACLMYRCASIKLRLKDIRYDSQTFGAMMRIGLPTGIQSSMYNISNVIVQSTLNGFGVDTMAAWTAYGKIDSFFWMINNAFGIALTTFVGQNYGAGKYNRIRKSVKECMAMALVTCAVISVAYMMYGPFLLRLFTSDVNVITIGYSMMQVICPTYFIFIFIELFSGTLRAEGHVAIPTLITIVGVCVLRILWVKVIVPGGTIGQICACYPVTWIASAVPMTIYYFFKQNKVLKLQA